MALQRQQIRYTGRVQGVGFRMSTRRIARGFAVTGWVRNESDGSVLVEVQGTPQEIAAFVGTLRRRMAGFVESEVASEVPPAASEPGFDITTA